MKSDKQMINFLMGHGGLVRCPFGLLFDKFVIELKKDNYKFYELLYHMEFRETLKDIINLEGRNLAHIASFLKA